MRFRSISISVALALFAAALSVLPGCINPNTNAPTATTQTTPTVPCTMKFSGAFVETVPCMILCRNVVAASNSGTQNVTAITITLNGTSPDVTAAMIQIEDQGTPTTTTYPDGNVLGYDAVVSRTVNGVVSVWSVSQQTKTGSLGVTFSSVQPGQGQTVQNGTSASQTFAFYSVHGTAQASLIAPPAPVAPGATTIAAPLTMTVTF